MHPAQLALFGPQPVHLFRPDPLAIRIDPRGNRLGEKLRRGAWRCVICRADGEFDETWGTGCCRGGVPSRAARAEALERAA